MSLKYKINGNTVIIDHQFFTCFDQLKVNESKHLLNWFDQIADFLDFAFSGKTIQRTYNHIHKSVEYYYRK